MANGVLDGADCVMLSGEMAAGLPKEAVAQMSSIIETVEEWTRFSAQSDRRHSPYFAHDAHDKVLGLIMRLLQKQPVKQLMRSKLPLSSVLP